MKQVQCILAVVAAMSVLALSCASTGGSGGGASKEAVPVVPVFSWNFDDPDAGTAGWVVAEDEFWDYKGTAAISRDDTTLGKAMLRVDLDYTKDTNSEWSEPKIKFVFSEPLDLSSVSRFNFDFYYNPALSKRGSFKSKVVVIEGGKERTTGEVEYLKDEDADNGYKVAKVSLRIRKVSGKMEATVVGIPGYRTDYKGPVFFDNIYWD
jgi:hypothetical protein